MVGGSSSIPLVIRKMQEIFGEQRVLVHPRPMLAIAEGAAVLAHRLSETYECPACGQTVAQTDPTCGACQFDLATNLAKTGVVDIVHTVSHDYYLALEDGNGYRLVEQNTPLPLKTQAAFKLIHAEQRLAHFKFYNMVNDVQESIGDLWLSFDLTETDVAEDQVQDVLLDFEIDENNLITVAAALKELPDVNVSRTLSRGNVDEKLFLDLEESIARVNRDKHDYYVVYDFRQRVIGIAKEINQVVNPETGEANDAIRQQVVGHQAVAEQLVARETSALPNVYYAEAFLSGEGRFLDNNQRRSLEKKIAAVKEENDKRCRASLGSPLQPLQPILQAVQGRFDTIRMPGRVTNLLRPVPRCGLLIEGLQQLEALQIRVALGTLCELLSHVGFATDWTRDRRHSSNIHVGKSPLPGGDIAHSTPGNFRVSSTGNVPAKDTRKLPGVE